MDDISKKAADTKALLTGTLIVGNHDSISLFGIHAQNSLKDYSRKVTSLLLKNTEELDVAVSEIVTEIEQFESTISAPPKTFWGRTRQRKNIVGEFHRINTYIENTTIYFKLQQAHLIKEIKLLEKLDETVKSCTSELKDCIEIGKRVLQDRPVVESAGLRTSALLQDDSDNEIWYSRLQKRVDDLSVSHVVSLQNQAQIKMLHDSDLILLDKIASAIANTFPIWQNQMAVMLGIDLMEKRMESNNYVLDISEKNAKAASKQGTSKLFSQEKAPFHSENIQKADNLLREMLLEMASLEKNDTMIRQDIQKVLQHVERGQVNE